MYNFLKLVMACVALYSLYLLMQTMISSFLSVDSLSVHKKRLKQLEFNNKRTSSGDSKEFIDKITAPVVTHILPKIKTGDLSQLEKDLQMSQWDKFFTPTTFVAMDVLLKILGVIMFLILSKVSLFMAILWGCGLFFLFKFLFNNSIKERKFRLMSQFPEFIEVTAGFLNSKMDLPQGIEYALPYVGEEWKPILNVQTKNKVKQ